MGAGCAGRAEGAAYEAGSAGSRRVGSPGKNRVKRDVAGRARNGVAREVALRPDKPAEAVASRNRTLNAAEPATVVPNTPTVPIEPLLVHRTVGMLHVRTIEILPPV